MNHLVTILGYYVYIPLQKFFCLDKDFFQMNLHVIICYTRHSQIDIMQSSVHFNLF